MRDVYRIGRALALAVFFGGVAAGAQTGGTGTAAQPAGVEGSGTSGQPAGAGVNPQSSGSAPSVAGPGTTSAPTSRMSTFNRVTTTRKVAVPAPSLQARRAVASGGGGSAAAARQKIPNDSEVPADSSARRVPERTTRAPATGMRAVTHNYYPGLRGGQYVNSNTARVAHGARGRVPRRGGGSGNGGRPVRKRDRWAWSGFHAGPRSARPRRGLRHGGRGGPWADEKLSVTAILHVDDSALRDGFVMAAAGTDPPWPPLLKGGKLGNIRAGNSRSMARDSRDEISAPETADFQQPGPTPGSQLRDAAGTHSACLLRGELGDGVECGVDWLDQAAVVDEQIWPAGEVGLGVLHLEVVDGLNATHGDGGDLRHAADRSQAIAWLQVSSHHPACARFPEAVNVRCLDHILT